MTTRKVMERFLKLNKAGRKRVLEIMDDYTRIPEYLDNQEE